MWVTRRAGDKELVQLNAQCYKRTYLPEQMPYQMVCMLPEDHEMFSPTLPKVHMYRAVSERVNGNPLKSYSATDW